MHKLKINRENRIIISLGYLFFGFSFSWLSQLLISEVIGNNLVEIFLIPSIILLCHNYFFKKTLFETLYSKKFIFTFILVLLGFIIGILNSGGSIVLVYGDFRANIIFMFLIYFLTNKFWSYNQRRKIIVNIMLVVAVLDFITLILRPILNFVATKQPISIIIPAILSIYYLKINKYYLSLIFIILASFEGVIGFYRNYYIIIIITYLIYIFIIISNFVKSKNKNRKYSVFLGVLIVLIGFYTIPLVSQYWNSSESRMIHSINRTYELVKDQSTENQRIGSVLSIYKNPELFLLPKGIGWRNFMDKISNDFKEFDMTSSMDSSFFYMAYHYGLFVLLFVIMTGFFKVKKSFFKKQNSYILFNSKIRFLFLLLFLVSFFSQGIMLTTLQGAFSYALLYSIIVKPI